MECFTVYSDLIEGRIDPHFYRQEFRNLQTTLETLQNQKLQSIVEFSNELWNQNDFFENEFPYIEIGDIDTEMGEIKNITYYKKDKAPSRAKMIVRENDIIISTTRPQRGAIAIIDKRMDGFIASTGFAVLRKMKVNNIKKEYLLSVLHTQICLKQMLQRSSGGNYPAITLEELKNIIIPIPSSEIQNKIVEMYNIAKNIKKINEFKAQKIFDSIDTYVLDKLGIKLPELKDKMFYTVSSSTVQNNRTDPYYYQPKFKEVESAIEKGKYGLVKIEDLLEYYKKGIEVGSEAYTEEGVPFIRVSDIKDYKIDYENTKKKIKKDLYYELKEYQPEKDELLYSKDGSIGFCPIVGKDKEAIISGGILRLKIKEEINSFFVKSILSSSFMKLLANREGIGSIIKHLPPKVFLSIKVPLPPIAIQNEIAEGVKKRVKEAEQLQKEANEKLEEAKQQVERLILNS
ncbi:Type I restriction enzyme MjaXIP specificity protein [Candidatus Micrarchaeum sp.]|uniref:restriction endonuclease subunit S n=1 Tax=Candidatus Micrarchaeum sp. TaxID=2282148 RepID=UPI000B7186A8|nr:restriction endonuclease subunit S [Candidatus Micrarchaeum sp.]OWP54011.1 MAG: hypothetical protein B2I19_00675 [Thermoplasmatales archaeon ARMAN]QRF73596.1 Type I restriction enzyme MjaXIP specificity protein [Candidatus Micrarchaeum sp.]